MNINEIIEKDLEEGKSLDESLRVHKIRFESLVLDLLKENNKLKKRVDVIEKYINAWIEETMTPW